MTEVAAHEETTHQRVAARRRPARRAPARRRDRIVQATLELMLERDYDSLQMKDITAGVGGGARDRLPLLQLQGAPRRRGSARLVGWFRGSTEMPPARSIDRLKLAYRRAARAFERSPCLYDHLLALQASDDPYA